MPELTKKQRYWKKHLEAAALFDGSLADYAREHDLNPKKLYVFKNAIAKKEQPGEEQAFAAVTITNDCNPVNDSYASIVIPPKSSGILNWKSVDRRSWCSGSARGG